MSVSLWHSTDYVNTFKKTSRVAQGMDVGGRQRGMSILGGYPLGSPLKHDCGEGEVV